MRWTCEWKSKATLTSDGGWGSAGWSTDCSRIVSGQSYNLFLFNEAEIFISSVGEKRFWRQWVDQKIILSKDVVEDIHI